MMDKFTLETVTNPCWFPLRASNDGEEVQFVLVPPETHRAITFLTGIRPFNDDIRRVPRSLAAQVPVSEAPLHMILHSGLGGSTLLARALGQPGVVTTLKEPPILTDVIAFGLDAPRESERELLRVVTRLLSRPFASGEAIVVKMSSIGNGLGVAIAEDRPNSQILCLQTPLPAMVASLACRGDEGREGGRRLFTGLRNARMIAVEPADARGDLELAALAWLSIQKIMVDAATGLGPKRVRSLQSEQFIARPHAALSAVASHLNLALDVDARLASGIFERHAKTGEPFDRASRARQIQSTLRAHGNEIREIENWARKVADANKIAWDLPYPLLD